MRGRVGADPLRLHDAGDHCLALTPHLHRSGTPDGPLRSRAGRHPSAPGQPVLRACRYGRLRKRYQVCSSGRRVGRGTLVHKAVTCARRRPRTGEGDRRHTTYIIASHRLPSPLLPSIDQMLPHGCSTCDSCTDSESTLVFALTATAGFVLSTTAAPPYTPSGALACSALTGYFALTASIPVAGAYRIAVTYASGRPTLLATSLAVGWGPASAHALSLGAPASDRHTVAIGARVPLAMLTRDAAGAPVPCVALDATSGGDTRNYGRCSAWTSDPTVLWTRDDVTPDTWAGTGMVFSPSDGAGPFTAATRLRCHACTAAMSDVDAALSEDARTQAATYCSDVSNTTSTLGSAADVLLQGACASATGVCLDNVTAATATWGFAVIEAFMPNRTGNASFTVMLDGAGQDVPDEAVGLFVMSCLYTHSHIGFRLAHLFTPSLPLHASESPLKARFLTPPPRLLSPTWRTPTGNVTGPAQCAFPPGFPSELLAGVPTAALLVASDPFGRPANCSDAAAARFEVTIAPDPSAGAEQDDAAANASAVVACGDAGNVQDALVAWIAAHDGDHSIEEEVCMRSRGERFLQSR